MKPWGDDAVLALADAGVEAGLSAGADGVEVSVQHHWGGLTRFAASQIHQNVASEDAVIRVRAVIGGRVGVATTNDASAAGARQVALDALEAARLSPADPTFAGLAPASSYASVERYDEATAIAPPAVRAEAVASMVEAARDGQEAAGALKTGASERAIVTSDGCRAYGLLSEADHSVLMTGNGATSYANDAGWSLDMLDPPSAAALAAATCAAAADPAPIDPGRYDVVLMPAAVATLVEYLSDLAFNAKEYLEGQSAFCDRLGERVTSELVTIADDALAPDARGLPFDDEGTPRRRIELVQQGIAAGLAHDRSTAAAMGVDPTGHGLPAPNTNGPFCAYLVLEPGASSVEELIAGVERGLLVTRFWYTRVVNPMQTTLTGMTRDGTFLIEDGEVRGPVRNLRFNESVLDALSSCDGVGNELRRGGDEYIGSRMPAIRTRGFTFSSTTDH